MMRLTLLRRVPGTKTAEYLCECGVTKVLVVSNVGPTKTRSCGCFRKARNTERFTKHGHRKNDDERTRTYATWINMKSRCENPARLEWGNYGGRGIQVCPRWCEYENFLEDMGECPGPDVSLDRIDNSKGYNRDNCRWATKSEQNNNKRNNVTLTLDGVTKTQEQWSRELGISRPTLIKRRNLGLPVEQILKPGRAKRTPTPA